MLKSGLTLLSGNAAGALLLLMRNLSIAVLIPVADYGIAATFAIAMAVVEMATDLGLNQQIIQSDRGEDPRFQAALQGFQVLRGTFAGAVLFLLAGQLSALMGVPEVAWAYQLLASVPVLNGLRHFDMHRMHREMRFGPTALIRTVPALLSFLVAWPLAAWLGDYRVMLWAILLQMTATLVLSHWVSQRPYQLVFDTQVMRDSLAFGWPLLISGALLFAVFQGDKVIVARLLGMEALALIAMGFTLTLTPTMVLSTSLQNFFLPQLSRRDGDFARLAQVAQEAALLVALAFLALAGLLAPLLVSWVLGAKYAALVPLLIWLALMQALRIAKGGHSVVALSVGVTTLAMWANLARVAVLPLVWWVATQGGNLMHIVWLGILGELAGYAIGLWFLRKHTALPIVLRPQLAFAAVMIASALTAVIWPGTGLTLTLIIGSIMGSLTFLQLRAHLRQGAQPT